MCDGNIYLSEYWITWVEIIPLIPQPWVRDEPVDTARHRDPLPSIHTIQWMTEKAVSMTTILPLSLLKSIHWDERETEHLDTNPSCSLSLSSRHPNQAEIGNLRSEDWARTNQRSGRSPLSLTPSVLFHYKAFGTPRLLAQSSFFHSRVNISLYTVSKTQT